MSENKQCKHYIIYRIYHLDSPKSYIGITTGYKRRMSAHFKYSDGCKHLKRAMNKYGAYRFVVEIIDICGSIDELKLAEIRYIKFYNTKKQGYNMTNGGDGTWGFEHTPEQKKANSERQMGRKPSKKARKNMSNAQMGRKHPIKTRNKISEAHQKLSICQVLEIQKMITKKILYKIIAKKYNIGRSTISRIKHNKVYTNTKLTGFDINDLPKRNRKFTDDQILEIRKMLINKIPQRKIAKKFNVVHSTIGQIKRNGYYSDIQTPIINHPIQ